MRVREEEEEGRGEEQEAWGRGGERRESEISNIKTVVASKH